VFGVLLVFLLQRAPTGLWPIITGVFHRRSLRGGDDEDLGTSQPTKTASTRAVREAEPLPKRDRPAAGEVVLEVRAIRKEFGGLVAVNDISFKVRAGEIMGLIGPNGAGKSTTFNLVTGMLPITRGEVLFRDQRIDGALARKISAMGVGRTFQHVQLLPGMSVIDNVALGAHLRSSVGMLRASLRLDRKEEARLRHEAALQLKRVGLGSYLFEQAGNLALGQQRILEIARALASDPVLLLLDEPAAGLRYKEKVALADVLRQLRAEGMSILLVEHDMEFVMGLTDHLVVMEFGSKLAEGLPKEIQTNPKVLEAYLGGIDDDLALEQPA
jgi:branched-chain amino acid transport system permease protein